MSRLEELRARSSVLGLIGPRIYGLVNTGRQLGNTDFSRGVLASYDVVALEKKHVEQMCTDELNREADAKVAENDRVAALEEEIRLLRSDLTTIHGLAKARKISDTKPEMYDHIKEIGRRADQSIGQSIKNVGGLVR